MTNVSKWMNRERSIDLVVLTSPDLQMPNVNIYLGQMVITPVGITPSGIIFWQPIINAAPFVFGLVNAN